MAILKKRTSSKQIPDARGFDRAPLDSIIRGAGSAPSISGNRPNLGTPSSGPNTIPSSGGSNVLTNSGGSSAPITSTVTGNRPTLTTGTTPAAGKPATTAPKTSLVPKTTLTSKTTTPTTKPTVATKPVTPTKPVTSTPKPTTPVKPPVTTKPVTTPTKTTSPTSTVKPVVAKPPTNTNSTTSKVVNALTGAAVGAGTKLIIDRITGKPTVVPKAPSGTTTPKAPAVTKPPAGVIPKAPVVKPPITSTVLTDEEVLAELDRVKASEEAGEPPEGAVDNGDGTYSVTEDGMVTKYDANGDIVSMEAAEEVGGGSETVVADNGAVTDSEGVEYYQDEDGNYYTMNDGGSYDLAYYADGTYVGDVDVGDELVGGVDVEDDTGTEYAETTYTDPDTGEVWNLGDGGVWTLEGDEGAVDDTLFADDTTSEDDTLFADDTLYEDDTIFAGDSYNDEDYYDDEYDYAKKGGLMTMMKKGGVPKFAEGNLAYFDTDEEVQDWQNVDYNYGEDDDPVLTGDKSLYSQSGPINNDYLKRTTPIAMASNAVRPADVDNSGDINFTSNSSMNGDDVEFFDNGDGTASYWSGNQYVTVDSDSGTELYRTDEDGKIVSAEDEAPRSGTVGSANYYIDDGGNTVYTDNEGNMTIYDPDGNIIPEGGARVNQSIINEDPSIANVGGGKANTKKDVYQTDAAGNMFKNGVFYRAPEVGETPEISKGIGADLLNSITGALGTTAGAAGAGALIASLLGSDFSGGGGQNLGVDMSQVGLINPRTTDFGIGPTNFVGYDQYGTDEEGYAPNEELLRNLNAPGFNPVNEGDYGYEEVPTEEPDEAPAMASGGLSSMATPVSSYYTFGQPADILANLGMRPQPPMNPPEMMPQIGQQKPPQQMQQQGLPQQMPPQMAQQSPQGMPQQGMMPQQQGMPPPMRRGGLPHASDVPMTQGRMDFRQGAAVHGEGDGQSDDIPAMLADGEYVIDSETVAQIGNGSTKAGAQALDKFRESIRAHKRSAPVNKIPPKTKALTSYLKGAR